MEYFEKIIEEEHDETVMYIIVSVVLILLIYVHNRSSAKDLGYIKSTIDGNHYLCRPRNDALRAANVFAEINRRLLLLSKHLRRKYKNPKLNKRLSKYKSSAISEAGAKNPNTSYLINKGQSLVLCIRDKSDEYNLLDINTIMFVALHEFSHLISVSIGHTEEFWSNFKFALINAREIGIYKEEDYEKSNKPYCGIKITNSPLYSNSIVEADWAIKNTNSNN